MNEVLMIPPNQLGNLKKLYKERITRDSTLDTAAGLAAAQHKILKDKTIPPGIKKAKVKAVGSTLNRAVKKYRQGPFTSTITPDDTHDSLVREDEQSKAFQQLLFNILRGQPNKKKKPPSYKPKATPKTKKTRKTEVEKLQPSSDWLPYDTRTQTWGRKRKRT